MLSSQSLFEKNTDFSVPSPCASGKPRLLENRPACVEDCVVSAEALRAVVELIAEVENERLTGVHVDSHGPRILDRLESVIFDLETTSSIPRPAWSQLYVPHLVFAGRESDPGVNHCKDRNSRRSKIGINQRAGSHLPYSVK